MLIDLTLPAAVEVCRAMRADDARCIKAMCGSFDPDAFAAERCKSDGPAWSLFDEAGLIGITGLAFTSAWSAALWLVMHQRADNMPCTSQSWRKLVRLARTVISNALNPANPHARRRIEAHVLSDWPEARRLVRHLGFQHEGTCRQSGSGGEDIEIWSRVAEGN